MKYRCLVIDDQLIERDAIEMFLSDIPQLEVVATCADALEASKVLAEEQVDVVFSDIDMPRLSGLGLLKSLKHPPVFIFITSHAEYAVESYELDVVDFVMKPASFERVLKAANKAVEYLELKRSVAWQKSPEQTPEASDTYFFIRENHDLVKLEYGQVSYIESMGNFSKIFTTHDRKHITLVGLKNLEMLLPPTVFLRIHKQHIVNMNHISVIGQGNVTLSSGHSVPVGVSYRTTLMEKVVEQKIVTRFTE